MSWLLGLALVLGRSGCVARGCLVSFGYEREADDELLFVVDHYEPGRRVAYARYGAGWLVRDAPGLADEVAARLASGHGR